MAYPNPPASDGETGVNSQGRPIIGVTRGSLLVWESNDTGVSASISVIDTSGGNQAVTFDGTEKQIKVYGNNGGNQLTINAGGGNTFRGGGTSVVSLNDNDTIVLMLNGTIVEILANSGNGGNALTDGDKGDVVVSSSGTVFTVDNDAVTFAKLQDISTQRIVGRSTTGIGDPEELSANDVLSWIGNTDGTTLYNNGGTWAAANVAQFIFDPPRKVHDVTASGAAVAWSLSEGAILELQNVNADVTVTVTDDRVGGTNNRLEVNEVLIVVTQDGTGGRTVIMAGDFPAGLVTLSPTAMGETGTGAGETGISSWIRARSTGTAGDDWIVKS